MTTGHSTATGGKEKYRPSYMDHFEKKEQESQAQRAQPPAPVPQPVPQKQVTPPHHFQRSLMEGNFEFVSNSVLNISVLQLTNDQVGMVSTITSVYKNLNDADNI